MGEGILRKQGLVVLTPTQRIEDRLESQFPDLELAICSESFVKKRYREKVGSPLPTDPPYVEIYVEPNVLEDPIYAVYADCSDDAIKAIYR